jgi:hypothetical protein
MVAKEPSDGPSLYPDGIGESCTNEGSMVEVTGTGVGVGGRSLGLLVLVAMAVTVVVTVEVVVAWIVSVG